MSKNKSKFPHQEYIDALKDFSEVNSEARFVQSNSFICIKK